MGKQKKIERKKSMKNRKNIYILSKNSSMGLMKAPLNITYYLHWEIVFIVPLNTYLNQYQNLVGNNKAASATTGQQSFYYVQLELR